MTKLDQTLEIEYLSRLFYDDYIHYFVLLKILLNLIPILSCLDIFLVVVDTSQKSW